MSQRVAIPIESPRRFEGKEVLGEITSLGAPGDYKPCVAKLPSGELVLVAFSALQLQGPLKQHREEILLFRSGDGGRSWSKPQNLTVEMGLVGREPYFTIIGDGNMFLTVTLTPSDVRNTGGYNQAWVHSSEDGGRTWTSVLAEPAGLDPSTAATSTTRNIPEMQDGSLLLGVGGRGLGLPNRDYFWRSHDRGRTWSERYPAQIAGLAEDYQGFLWEAFLWQAASGKVLLLARVDPRHLPQLGDAIPESRAFSDQYERMAIYETTDEGRTVRPVHGLGVVGEMYPSILRLHDGRLLLTFTVRNLRRPLGVRAVVGEESHDGVQFDMTNDRLVLDAKTPPDMDSGGGFGPTVQLDDGTLVTSYSWRDTAHISHVEVIRWRLPD
jgi:hypothetical protein